MKVGKKMRAAIAGLACFLFYYGAAFSATLLPQGAVTFFDNNGAPLAGGQVFFYIPGTTTPKSTWSNAAGTTLNPNPIILDAAGRAVIYGTGAYQETVEDLHGNLIWSQPTSDTSANGYSWAGTSTGSANVQILTAPNFSFGDGQVIGFIAGYTNTGATTLTVNGQPPINVVKGSSSGPIALSGGEIVSGNQYQVSYSVTNGNFQLLSFPLSTSSGIYSALVTSTGSGIFYSPIIDAAALGFVGDGSTINNSQFAQLSTVAANGGEVKFGCGVYKITAPTAITVAASKHLTVEGGGVDCTELWFSGTNGTAVASGGQFASVTFKDMTISTDGTSNTGLQWSNTNTAGAGTSLIYGPQNALINVNFRGHDQYGVNANVWGLAFSEQNISNLLVLGGGCNQSPTSSFAAGTQVGTCYNLSGYTAGTSYSSNINFVGVSATNCATAIFYGDYVKDVHVSDENFIGCKNGIITPTSTTEALSGLSVSGGTIYSSACDICEITTNFSNLSVFGVKLMVAPGAAALQSDGSNWSVTGNQFVGIGTPASSATVGLNLAAAPAGVNGGIATGNTYTNLTTAEQWAAAVSFSVQLGPNKMTSNYADFSVGASSSGVLVIDNNPRPLAGFFACNSSSLGDQLYQSDSPNPAYNTLATSGGSVPVRTICDVSNSRWSDR